MNLPLLLAGLFVALVHPASGCRRSGSIPPRDAGAINDPVADVWLGKLQFVSYMCGWPNDTTSVQIGVGLLPRQNIFDPLQLIPTNLEPIHSLVYFRGRVYEWGAGLLRSYANGTLGRDPHGCPVAWALGGQSNCSLAQVGQVAASYRSRYGAYDLLQNNCHSFSGRLAEKLLRGDCIPF